MWAPHSSIYTVTSHSGVCAAAIWLAELWMYLLTGQLVRLIVSGQSTSGNCSEVTFTWKTFIAKTFFKWWTDVSPPNKVPKTGNNKKVRCSTDCCSQLQASPAPRHLFLIISSNPSHLNLIWDSSSRVNKDASHPKVCSAQRVHQGLLYLWETLLLCLISQVTGRIT